MNHVPNSNIKYALAGTLLCLLPCLFAVNLLPVVGAFGVLASATFLFRRRRGMSVPPALTPARLWTALVASTLAMALGTLPIRNDLNRDEDLSSEQDNEADVADERPAADETLARPDASAPSTHSASAAAQTVAAHGVQPSGPADPIDVLLREAISVEEFERRLTDKEWAFFPRGVRSCEPGEEPDYLPPGDDEFARRLAEQQRGAVRDGLVGTVVRFEGSGTLAGTDPVFDTVTVGGGAFDLYRSAYDFRAGAYTFHLVANSDLSGSSATWPLCTRGVCTPDIRPETFVSEVQRTIGRVGDRDVSVLSSQTDVEWQNFSRLSFRAQMPEADAARLGRNMPIQVLLLLRFEGLGHHQRCQRNCDVIFGERICGGDDMGMGLFKKASLVGYRVRSGETLLSQLVVGEAGN
ncbi:MAG: hypothetical protein U0230_15925 [Polyangiales bacterium]